MKKFQKNTLTGLALTVSAAALLAGAPVYAQDQDETDPDGIIDNDPDDDVLDEDEVASEERIVVTGSRVRTDTYTSISPLQTLSTEVERDVGNFDAAQILQRSEAAAGIQIDATFQGFVLDNGPGSQTLNLRGLGAERTLLLINGRRLAPAGVEGAPTSPSINLLPASLIDRYDLLLDGASSVYGSDAVAGVGNIVLRNDIDGFEVFLSGNYNPEGGGDDYTVSGAWGQQFSNGFIGIGAEYSVRDEVRLRDRPFLRGCDTHYEITDTGEIRTVGLRDNAIVQRDSGGAVSVSESECKIGGISGRIFNPFNFSGSIYFQADGQGNFPGFPDFPYADSTNAFGEQLDRDGDGIRDVDFQDVNTNAANIDQVFISRQELYNVMAYGEYTLDGDMNLTPFFELLYSRAEISADNTGVPQIFPSVPDINPFNPCNINTNPDGVDCRLIDNAQNNGFPLYGPNGQFGPAGFSLPVVPISGIRGDRNNTDITQEQYRAVLGVRGDLPFIDDSWTFEVSGVYSRSEGLSVRNGIREDRLALSLGIDPTQDFDGDGVADDSGDGIADDYDNGLDIFGAFGDPQYIGPCGTLANPDLAAPDLVQGCVPVNLFAPSVLTGAIGDFATQAERDYLFDQRIVDTTYEQIVLSAYATGDLAQLPAGPLALVVGTEFRNDSIETNPNFQASNGLFFGFFRDLGTNGEKYIIEAFAELDVPVFDTPELGTLDVNLSGRLTEEEFYGTAGTYSIKAGWAPVPEVLLKASYGTSFRAPNLRENFLGGITGFATIFDPCAVPDAAFDALNGGYQPGDDTRDPDVIQNCQTQGRDPFTVGINDSGSNTIATSSIEVANQGSLDLDPETSTSFTTGVAVGDSWGDFDFSFNFNYYAIVVEDSIASLSAQFAINECFFNDQPQTPSIFCDQLEYDTVGRNLINQAFPQFLNQDEEKVRGIDLNATLGYDVTLGGEVLSLGLNLRANHLLERSTLFVNDDGEQDFDEDQGEFGFPLWTGRATFSAQYSDFAFTWQTRWIGETEQQATGIDPLDDAFGNLGTGFFGDTCTGDGAGVVEGDGVFCRDIGFADDYFVHTASIRYTFDDWITLRLGVSNIFDEAPPLIDCNEPITCISNTPLGNGYDLDGREFFGTLSVRF
ncbi:TonB-dependent receptor domain-containing protein [Aurantiacibacter sediminis]|uniref:TonB-dependent receptor n=2 Tax=Aurantiacibacter sediminis TaxID=2793064 RepID=A0ABS0N6F5_9SPHN|nr:TonB-dependent receptor [Aurantiacibacter sediminis]MBH5323356.1 TonB-dependent receptor [Aurantiacibacter sediminis]